MRRRPSAQSTIKTALIVLGAIVVIVLIGNVVSFLTTRERLPRSTYLGGVDVSGLGVDEAISRTARTLQAPVSVRYQAAIIPLQPAEVEFQLNEVVAQLQLQKVLRGRQGLDHLPEYVLQRNTETRVPIPYQYSEARLDEFLNKVASEHNQDPVSAQPDLNALTVGSGQDGLSLNMNEARRLVVDALASTNSRFVDLPVDVVPGSGTNIKSLGELIKARLANFINGGNVAGVYVKDLGTGQEFSLNGDVAFSGQGWLKLALAVEAYRAGETPAPELAAQVAAMLKEGSGARANDVLRATGQGDPQAGVSQLNATLKRMGLVSTFLAQPFDDTAKPPLFVTPANSRTDISASPDASAQSTPIEVGLLFEMLEQCRNNTGALPLAFPNEYTPAKCDLVLNAIGQNSANVLISAGSPNAAIIHRQSWDANNHGDAALVRTPGGVYTLAVMLHSNTPLNWTETSLAISDIARAAYGFFNNGQVPPAVATMNAAPPP
jgi:hypothetical protein